MADFKKINANAESDNMTRKGLSAVYKELKEKKARQNKIKDPDTKKSLLEFIFSGKDSEIKNPLESN